MYETLPDLLKHKQGSYCVQEALEWCEQDTLQKIFERFLKEDREFFDQITNIEKKTAGFYVLEIMQRVSVVLEQSLGGNDEFANRLSGAPWRIRDKESM